MGAPPARCFSQKNWMIQPEHGSKLAGIPAHMIEMQYGNINNNDIWYISVSENGDIPYGITIQNGNW